MIITKKNVTSRCNMSTYNYDIFSFNLVSIFGIDGISIRPVSCPFGG